MSWTIEAFIDFAGALAILGCLAMGYGGLRRQLPGTTLGPILLGAVFGLVAVLQMYTPLTPVEGVIVDMRCIPVALAGAFLGVRGMVVCLLIVAMARVSIGGIGWVSGVASVILAGAAGILWNRLTTGDDRRSLRAMIGLAAMMSVHVVAVLLLPKEVALWFVTVAVPVVVGLNLVAVPLVALALERERIAMLDEARMRAHIVDGTDTGFLAGDLFARTLARLGALPPLDGPVTLMSLRLRRRNLLTALWGENIDGHVMREVRARLEAVLPEGAVAGLLSDETVLIALPHQPPEACAELAMRVRRDVGEIPIEIPGMAAFRPVLTIRHAGFARMPLLAECDGRLGLPSRSVAPVPAPRPTPSPSSGSGRLFHIADRMIEACEGTSRSGGRMV